MTWRPFMAEPGKRDVLLLAILPIVIILFSLLYLHPFSQEFPMDDTYIHFVYAENLAEGKGLYFSFPDEQGVGTTSILWVAILAAGQRAGLSMTALTKIMGVLSLLCSSSCVYMLLKPIFPTWLSWLGALLVGASGNMLWFALSGMETMLFVALGLLSLLAYRHKQWVGLGLLLGCLALTRPEGIMLSVAVGLLEFLRERKITRGLLIAGGLSVLIASPWYAYLYLRTGHFLPTSAVGKQLTHRVGMQFVLDSRPGMTWLDRVPALIYIGSWVVYLLEFTLGGMALPEPHIPLASLAEGLTYSFSVWAVASWAIVFVLIWAGMRRFFKPARWRYWMGEPHLSPWLLFLTWIVLHNLVFMIGMPVPGTASRYGAINHVLLWLLIVFGLSAFLHRRRWYLALVGSALLIAGVNTFYWDKVYLANLEHMREVRIAAAEYLREETPLEDLCAASDIGAIRYFSGRPIIDMGALVNPDAGRWFLEGASDDYLISRGATCLVVPGRMNSAGEGWFDIVTIMGLSTSTNLKLEQLAVFEIDHDRWLVGYLPTSNYQASVVIYQLTPRR